MGPFALFCVISVAVTGLTSGAGVLPDSVNALVEVDVTFTTSLAPTGTPFATIIWTFDGNPIVTLDDTAPEYEGRVTLDTSTGSLELRDLSLRDTGVYTVTIIPTNDGPKTGFTTLNIYEKVSKPNVTVNDTDLVEFNDTVTLSCSAYGSSLPFLWFNGSVEVKPSDRVHFTDGGANVSIVTIDPVLRYDHGSYSCKVSNPVSSSTSDPISLSVSYGPDSGSVILEISPPGEDQEEGSNVILSCLSDSRPPAEIKWYLNGTLQSNTGPQWTLSNIQTDQSGTYSCEAFNSKTLQIIRSQSANISVWEKILNPSIKATPDKPVEGSSVNLTCDASGSILTRDWMINGAELKPSGNIVFYDENRVASFKKLNRQDDGKYTCKISNPISSDSADYRMTVNYGPENVITPKTIKVKVGEALKLSCSADSVPVAKYTWTKNGTILGQSHEYTKENMELTDSGEYTCRATNEITLKTSDTSCAVTVTDGKSSGCTTGCIVGIVIGVIAVILIVGGVTFFMLKKKKQTPKSNSRTDGEGQDNSTYAQNQEVQYADVRFVKKGGQNNPEYAQVRKNNRPPASSLPSYEAHAQRHGRPAPEPSTLYADVRVK